MTLPTPTVLLDDGTGSFPYDVTDKVLAVDGYDLDRGRQDWQGGVTSGSLGLTLNNSDGRFTPGSTTIATPSPIRVDQQIRLIETSPTAANLNLMTAENASFESGTIGTWTTAGTPVPVLTNSAVRAWSGTKSLLVT